MRLFRDQWVQKRGEGSAVSWSPAQYCVPKQDLSTGGDERPRIKTAQNLVKMQMRGPGVADDGGKVLPGS